MPDSDYTLILTITAGSVCETGGVRADTLPIVVLLFCIMAILLVGIFCILYLLRRILLALLER